LTEHFVNWLVSNGYEQDSFDRPDIGPSGSFGGKLNSAQQAIISPTPMVKSTFFDSSDPKGACAVHPWDRGRSFAYTVAAGHGQVLPISWIR